MKQNDTGTRRVTANLMDRLSQRVCLQFLLKLAQREWRHNVWKVILGSESERTFPIWTNAGFWAEQDEMLHDLDFWAGEPDAAITAWTSCG